MQHHEIFLQDILGKLGMGVKKLKRVPITVDREKGIFGALKRRFPDISLVFCRNHVLHDIEYWVKKHGGGRDDVKVLKDQSERIIDSADKDEFEAQCCRLAKGWSEEFVKYFNQQLKEDLLSNMASFYTKQFEAFKSKIPTNNISESINKMIKSQNLKMSGRNFLLMQWFCLCTTCSHTSSMNFKEPDVGWGTTL